MRNNIQGVLTAIVTPFTDDGSLHLPGLQRQILRQLAAGHSFDMAFFQFVRNDRATGTKGHAPCAGVAAVFLLQFSFLLCGAADGGGGLIQQSCIVEMGRPGIFQLIQCGFQVIGENSLTHVMTLSSGCEVILPCATQQHD